MNKLKIVLAAAAALLAICSCNRKATEDTLKTGDLVFVGIPMDYSIEEGSMDEAISSATGTTEELDLIHVAIAEVSADSTWIIDATIKHGVDRHPLDTFLTDFTLKDGSFPVFIIKRLNDPSKAEEFVRNAKKYLGQPYDVHFLPDNDSLYCSELVRDSYVGADGSYVFNAAPMNFKGPDGEFPLYWKQLFGLLGQSIPQDVPGTNPQDMSKSAAIHEVSVKLVK
ncbi:MAG: hypothetical protein IJ205_07940 [Bacteroidales bacterium]|nr:hypothetical protein [Bacteroidales bacterium]